MGLKINHSPWNKGLKGVSHSHRKGVSYEQEYGLNKANLIKSKLSLVAKGKRNSPMTEFKKGSSGFLGKHSNATKEKMSELKKHGLLKGVFKKGHKLSFESRKKLSITLRGLKEEEWTNFSNSKFRDRKCASYKLWRKSVFERDNYTCQVCNKREGQFIEAHHINRFISFPNERYDLNNGLTVCKGDCHTQMNRLSFETERRAIKVEF